MNLPACASWGLDFPSNTLMDHKYVILPTIHITASFTREFIHYSLANSFTCEFIVFLACYTLYTRFFAIIAPPLSGTYAVSDIFPVLSTYLLYIQSRSNLIFFRLQLTAVNHVDFFQKNFSLNNNTNYLLATHIIQHPLFYTK